MFSNSRFLLFLLLVLSIVFGYAQAPNISYAGPKPYNIGTPITPLMPVNSGGSVPANAYGQLTGLPQPSGSITAIATDSHGNVYAISGYSIFKVTPSDTFTLLAGGTEGSNDGVGASASFSRDLIGITTDGQDNVYVVDGFNDKIRKITQAGVVTTFATSGIPGITNPIFTTYLFNGGIVIDAHGNTFVADQAKNLITKIDSIGVISTFAGNGVNAEVNGNGTSASFASPIGLALDAAKNLYVADYAAGFEIRKITSSGDVSTLAGGVVGFADGTGTNAQLAPTGVATDAFGNVYVADYGNSAIRKISPAGVVTTLAGTGNPGVVDIPYAIATDTFGNLYFVNANNGIDKINLTGYSISPALPEGLSFDATTGIISGTPTAISAATNYVVTAYNTAGSSSDTVRIAVNPPLPVISYSGPQTYFARTALTPLIPISSGVAAPGYGNSPVALGSGFGIPFSIAVDGSGHIFVAVPEINAVLEIVLGTNNPPLHFGSGFNGPTGVAVDAAGNVYVADAGNNAIKEVFAGGGAPVTLGSGFNNPTGVSVDIFGNVYVADRGNNAVKEILVNNGTSVTLATGFNNPNGVAVDALGNVYVTDQGNNEVKKIPAGGGSPIALSTGFSNPAGIAVDAVGNVYVGDSNNNAIVEIPVDGGGSVILGSGFSAPYGVAVDGVGNVYVADQGNASVKQIIPVGGYFLSSPLPPGLNFDGATGVISGTPTALSPATNYTVTAYNIGGANAATVNIKVVSTNATLSNLSLSSGTLSPAFGSGHTNYTASVNNAISSITLTPTATDGTATVKVNGTIVTSGTATASIPLAVGHNTITTIVTAQDGTTTKTYTITVTRALSNVATLASLTLSSGTLSPAFAGGHASYTASVSNATASITIAPTTTDAVATVKVNGMTVTSGTASASLPLAVGHNTITTIVTAQDGTTTKTYTIIVTRAPSNAATLANLTLSSGTLSPAFGSGHTSYTASVINAVSSITLTPTTTDGTATVKVNGTTVTPGTASANIALAAGHNTITTIVTAQDGTTTKTYTVTVTRAPSSIATLANLMLSSGTLSPAFGSGHTSYTASVSNAVSSITLTPTSTDATATIKVNGMTVTTGTASAGLPLAAGLNVITAIVTAQDGTTTKTYTITVTRAPSAIATLAGLTLSSGALSPAFGSGHTSYTASVSNATASITLTPTTTDATATVKVNGTTVLSGTASASLSLVVGHNTITTIVTAQDGTTTKTYSVTVTRAATGGLADNDFKTSFTEPLNDGVLVHQGLSPNGDGANDGLTIEGITNYPENKLSIMSRNGVLVYEVKGYDNSAKKFDGRSDKSGKLQQPGTYFYSLEYKVGGVTKRKTGFVILKY